MKRIKHNWRKSPCRCRPGKSSWVNSLERMAGKRREERRTLRRENRRRVRRGTEDFIPYRKGMCFMEHPEW